VVLLGNVAARSVQVQRPNGSQHWVKPELLIPRDDEAAAFLADVRLRLG
jgi:hypothetical protein